MFKLKNKTAIITGGGSGIGQAVAMMFAKQGAAVHIVELNEDAANTTIAAISAAGGEAYIHLGNIADQPAIKKIFEQIGPFDILANIAGIAHIGKAETTEEADFERVMNVNVKGSYNCIYAAIPQFRKNGSGCIINMASIASNVGIPDRFAYSTSKGAIMAMTMSVAKDYIAENIRCNSISPARVHTPFVDGFLKNNYPGKEAEMFDKLAKTQPIGRMAKPEEIAALALYLCSDEAAFITGCDFPIDGGFIKLNN